MLTVLSVAYPLTTASPRTAGGAEQVLLTLDRGLVRRGHRSVVVAATGSRCQGLLVPVRIAAGELNDSTREQAQRSFRQTIGRVMSEQKVDVVHMHGLDFHQYLPEGRVPVVVTLHLPLEWYDKAGMRNLRAKTTLVAVSKSQAETVPDGMKIDATIPNGIDLNEYRPSRRKGEYALVMSRICSEKGIHLAIDAAKVSHTPVVIAGKTFGYPEHRRYFENVVQPRLGRDVRLVGPVGGKCKAELLAGAKCLLVASQAPETSSLAAMEAMASGTPVIAWRSGALSDIVEHGRTGWLVSSVEEMARAIARADDIDPAECRREAERRFSAEKMIARYMSLYQRVAAASGARELQAA